MPSCDLTWGENPDTMGPFGLDYAYMYECSSSSINPLVVIMYFLWIFYLISLLAQTASNYLSPTLSKICEKLNVAYDVAGVTFLAFGNGAPDFFSLIASFSGGVDILVGVGALLGGSMFVCTVVVGSIAILSPCDVSKRIFLRDISFHLMSIIAVSIIALIGRVYLPMVILLYAMYVVYVLMVVISSSRDAANHAHHLAKQRYLRKKQKTVSVEEMEIQTAFWHIDSTTASKASAATGAASANSSISIKRSLQSGGSSLSSSYSSSTPFASSVGSTATASSTGGGGGGGGYSFLLLSSAADKAKAQRDDDDEDGDASDPDRFATDADESNDGDGGTDPFYHRRRITISGGAPLDWDRIVVENYYAADRPGAYGKGRVMVGEESAGGIASARRPAAPRGAFTIDDDDGDEERGGRSRRSDGHSGDDGEGVRLIDFSDRQKAPGRAAGAKSSFLAGGEGLEASLLAAADDAADADDSDEEQEISFVSASSPNTAAAAAGGAFGFYDYRRLIPRSDGPNAWKLQTMYGASVLTSMYWQQWTLRRSLRHRFVDDWRRAGSFWEKLWVTLEAPASLARDLTIPTLEEAQWSKTVAMLHPVAAPVFALWVLGFFGSSAASSDASVSTASAATTATAARASRRLLATIAGRLTTTLSDACPALAAYARRLAAVKLAPQLAAAASALLSSSATTTATTTVEAAGDAAPTMSGFEVLLVVASCAGASLFIFLSTNTSRPPHSWLFAGVWALAAFVMCILWIYALAGELITILSVLGDELRLPPAFLGLTVLAWGNSIGDFFTNTAVAKQGYGTMALAGCYGGPVFNLLIGFGSSLLYATVQTYSDPAAAHHYYPVALDASSWVSLVFIVVALASTMAIVIARDYRMDRVFGVYLLVLYALYSVAQAILVMVERSR